MSKSAYRKENAKRILAITIISTILGTMFGISMNFLIEESNSLVEMIRNGLVGASAGLTISLTIQILENTILAKIRRLPLLINLLLITGIYSLIALIYYPLIYGSLNSFDSLKNEFYLFETMIFSLILSFSFSVIRSITMILGQKVLPRLLLGKYHKPSIEERFIMFLDLKGSTTIAENIGDQNFHSFLNDFFIDITEPILSSKAEIYKYVGDEVILTWKKEVGIKKNHAINSFFKISDTIDELTNKYKQKYNIIPEFRAGLHFGKVVIGEMGNFKMEIALTGDSMNTTARIEGACSQFEKDLLLSQTVVDNYPDIEKSFRLDCLGDITLKGKDNTLKLYTIS